MKKYASLSLYLLLSTAVAAAAAPAKPDIPASMKAPDIFVVHVGGFLGSSYSAQLKDRKVIYRKTARGKLVAEKAISVSAGQWQKFWTVMNEIHLEKWAKRYDNQNVADGTQWSISMRVNGKKYESGGSNNFPGDLDPAKGNNSPQSSERFKRLLKALRDLLGGVEFS